MKNLILSFLVISTILSCNKQDKAEEEALNYISKNYPNGKIEDCTEPSTVFKKGISEKQDLLNKSSDIQLNYLKTVDPTSMNRSEYKDLVTANEEFNNYYDALEKADAEKGYYLVSKCINGKNIELVLDLNYKVLNAKTDALKVESLVNDYFK